MAAQQHASALPCSIPTGNYTFLCRLSPTKPCVLQITLSDLHLVAPHHETTINNANQRMMQPSAEHAHIQRQVPHASSPAIWTRVTRSAVWAPSLCVTVLADESIFTLSPTFSGSKTCIKYARYTFMFSSTWLIHPVTDQYLHLTRCYPTPVSIGQLVPTDSHSFSLLMYHTMICTVPLKKRGTFQHMTHGCTMIKKKL